MKFWLCVKDNCGVGDEWQSYPCSLWTSREKAEAHQERCFSPYDLEELEVDPPDDSLHLRWSRD